MALRGRRGEEGSQAREFQPEDSPDSSSSLSLLHSLLGVKPPSDDALSSSHAAAANTGTGGGRGLLGVRNRAEGRGFKHTTRKDRLGQEKDGHDGGR